MVMPKMIRAQSEELVEDGGATQFEKFDRLMKRLLAVPKKRLDRKGAKPSKHRAAARKKK